MSGGDKTPAKMLLRVTINNPVTLEFMLAQKMLPTG